MAGRLSIYGAQAMITTFFGRATDQLGSMYLALIPSVPPTPYVSGSEISEVPDTAYNRLAITNDTFNWDNSSAPYQITNKLELDFPQAVTDWGQIKYFALCDSQVGGNLIMTGDFPQPVTVLTGDTLVVPINSLTVTLGPFFVTTDS